MKSDFAVMVRKQAGAAAWVLCGGAFVSVAISILDVIQGVILNDWSGIHPIERLNVIPVRIAFSVAVALIVGAAAVLAHRPPLHKRLKRLAFGATCGLATSSSLLGPWISRSSEFFWLILIFTLPVAFWVRVRLVRSNGA